MITAKKAIVFVLGKPFQPSLIFASKAGAYLSTFKVLHPWKGSLHYSQTLDWAGKTKHGKHSCILRTLMSYERKKFYDIFTWG